MARRRRPKPSLKEVAVTFKNGDQKNYKFLGKSTTGKSLKVLDTDGKILYLPLRRLEKYEV